MNINHVGFNAAFLHETRRFDFSPFWSARMNQETIANSPADPVVHVWYTGSTKKWTPELDLAFLACVKTENERRLAANEAPLNLAGAAKHFYTTHLSFMPNNTLGENSALRQWGFLSGRYVWKDCIWKEQAAYYRSHKEERDCIISCIRHLGLKGESVEETVRRLQQTLEVNGNRLDYMIAIAFCCLAYGIIPEESSKLVNDADYPSRKRSLRSREAERTEEPVNSGFSEEFIAKIQKNALYHLSFISKKQLRDLHADHIKDELEGIISTLFRLPSSEGLANKNQVLEALERLQKLKKTGDDLLKQLKEVNLSSERKKECSSKIIDLKMEEANQRIKMLNGLLKAGGHYELEGRVLSL